MKCCLTDRELINTAMSRARYSVAVVCDPLVLCTFGSCRTVWQKFVKACEALGSIYPDTYNMKQIKMKCSRSPSPTRAASCSVFLFAVSHASNSSRHRTRVPLPRALRADRCGTCSSGRSSCCCTASTPSSTTDRSLALLPSNPHRAANARRQSNSCGYSCSAITDAAATTTVRKQFQQMQLQHQRMPGVPIQVVYPNVAGGYLQYGVQVAPQHVPAFRPQQQMAPAYAPRAFPPSLMQRPTQQRR